MSESKTTTDHKEIQQWAESRQGKPSSVKKTGSSKDVGILRINFPGGAEDSLEDITWEEFFEKFDAQNLALVYQDKTADGKESRFNKLVSRQTAEEKDKKISTKAKSGAKGKSAAPSKTKATGQRSTAEKASGAKKSGGEKSKSSKSK